MNSSTVFKKTLPLIVILLIIIIAAVTCTALKRTKANPVFENSDEVYLSTKEGDYTYTITKGQMYEELKNNVGLSSLIIRVNKDILKKEGYFDKVKDEDIEKKIEEATFEDGKDGLTGEEIAEAEKKFSDTMFSSYGLKDENEIKEYYRLVLAKEAYAKDKLEEEIKEKDDKATSDDEKYFPNSKYTSYYNDNYQQEFWAIIVPYTTETQAKNALAQLGILVHTKDSKVSDDFNCWKWIAKDEEGKYLVDSDGKYKEGKTLTAEEVVKAMIDLYNTVYAYKLKNYPAERLVLNEGKQYTIDEFGNYVFNTTFSEDDETLNTLHYTYGELSKYQTGILNSMRNNWVAYTANSEVNSSAKWYTPTPQSYNSGSLYCFCLKIAENQPKVLDDVKSEITEALKKEALTTTYIETKMAELRAKYNFTIYDTELEKNYITSMKNYKVTHKATKVAKKNVIASIDEIEYTVNDFYTLMDQSYGVSVIMSLLNYERFMVNKEFNKYYAYKSDLAEKKKWTDTEKYKEMKEQIAKEKLVFTSGSYSSYGYSPDSMTWLEFIKAVYGANSENDLLIQYLYNDIISDYQKSLKDLSKADETSDLWKFYEEKMEGIKNAYFSVKGVHLLICIYDDPKDATDSKATPLDPKDWSEEQVKLAKELHDQVLKYVSDEEGDITTKFEDIAGAFKKALKYLPGLEQTVEAQPAINGESYTFKNIEVSKFRSAGLSVKYEDLGEFTNGKMVEEFDKAVKSIWDENPASESMTIYEDYLQTVYGFHVYANLKSNPLPEWTSKDEKSTGILPTLELIKKYIKDEKDETISDTEKTALTTYYTPIATELGGSYNSYIEEYKALQALDLQLEGANYSKEILNRAIEIALANWNEKLTYNKK